MYSSSGLRPVDLSRQRPYFADLRKPQCSTIEKCPSRSSRSKNKKIEVERSLKEIGTPVTVDVNERMDTRVRSRPVESDSLMWNLPRLNDSQLSYNLRRVYFAPETYTVTGQRSSEHHVFAVSEKRLPAAGGEKTQRKTSQRTFEQKPILKTGVSGHVKHLPAAVENTQQTKRLQVAGGKNEGQTAPKSKRLPAAEGHRAPKSKRLPAAEGQTAPKSKRLPAAEGQTAPKSKRWTSFLKPDENPQSLKVRGNAITICERPIQRNTCNRKCKSK